MGYPRDVHLTVAGATEKRSDGNTNLLGAVPLSQLAALDVHQSTAEAIVDWHYWVAQGYLF